MKALAAVCASLLVFASGAGATVHSVEFRNPQMSSFGGGGISYVSNPLLYRTVVLKRTVNGRDVPCIAILTEEGQAALSCGWGR